MRHGSGKYRCKRHLWKRDASQIVTEDKVTRASHTLQKPQKVGETTIAMTKSAEMDALHEKQDGGQGENFAIRLEKARPAPRTSDQACVDCCRQATAKASRR